MFNVLRRVATLALFCVLSGCASLQFKPDSGSGLLIVADRTPSGVVSYHFRRVDMQTRTFVGGYVTLAMGSASWGTRPAYGFDGEIVPAGDYALVQSGASDFNGVSFTSGLLCLNEAAPIYSVQPGKITLVRMDHIEWPVSIIERHEGYARWARAPHAADQELLEEFERSRAREFDEVSGDPTLAKPSAFVTYSQRGGSLIGASCKQNPHFDVLP